MLAEVSAESSGDRAARHRAEKPVLMDRYVAYLASGLSHRAASERVGRSVTTTINWRKHDAAFDERALNAIAQGRDPTTGDTSTFTARRLKFFHHETPWHHQRMIDHIETAEPDEVVLIVGPPGSGKTTCLCDYENDCIARDNNHRALFLSAGRDLAGKIADQARSRFEDEAAFGAFIEAYGPFVPEGRGARKRWSTTHFRVSGATHDEKEMSIESKGVGAKIYGTRFEHILFSDPQELSLGLLSPATDAVSTTLHQMAGTRVENNGFIVVDTSRLLQEDIADRLIEEEVPLRKPVQFVALYDHRGEPAYIEPQEMFYIADEKVHLVPGVEDEVVSYWPQRWPLLKLARKRNLVREEAWNRSYMQKPLDISAQTFSDAVLGKFCDRAGDPARIPADGYVMLGVDPAFVGWAGFVVVTCDAEKARVLHVERRRNLANIDGIASVVDDLCAQFRPQDVILESDFHAALADDSRIHAVCNRWGAMAVPHQTGNTKRDPVIGVAKMSSSMAAGELSAPYDSDEARAVVLPLIEELRKWRPDVPTRYLVQDRVMSMWFTWRRWVEHVKPTYGIAATPQRRPSWLGQRPVLAGRR